MKILGYISPTIGHIIPQDCYAKTLPSKTWSKNSIVIYCGMTVEPWNPEKINSGIGGSELAIIKLAPYWVRNGYEVFVYCNCDKPGNYEGVTYVHSDFFCINDVFDVLIVWRDIEFLKFIDISARKCIIDFHDVIEENDITEKMLKNVYKICFKSKFH